MVYLILDGLQKAFLILLTPVFAHYMPTSEVGQISLGSTVISILTIVLGSSLGAAVTRYHGKLLRNKPRYLKFMSTIYGLGLMLSFSAITLLFLLPEGVYQSLLPGFTFREHTLPMGLIAASNGLLLIFVSNIKVAQDIRTFTIYSISSLLGQGFLIHELVIEKGLGASGYFWSQALVNLGLVFGIFAYGFKTFRLSLSKKYLGLVMRYSLPVIPVDIISFVNAYVDRIFIAHFLGYESSGIYHVGVQLSLILYMILIALNSAITPYFFRVFDRRTNSFGDLLQPFQFMVCSSAILSFGLLLLAPQILTTFFPGQYYKVMPALPFLIFNYSVLAVYFFSTNALSTKPSLAKFRFLGIFMAGLVNLVLGYFLIPEWNLLGAALATASGQFVMATYFTWAAAQKTKLQLPNLWGFSLITGALAMAALVNLMLQNVSETATVLTIKAISIGVAVAAYGLALRRMNLTHKNPLGSVFSK